MRLIDADKITCESLPFSADELFFTMYVIGLQPTVNAVPVVRCKDCKHACKTNNKYGLACCIRGFAAKPDDFCSYGERRESHE